MAFGDKQQLKILKDVVKNPNQSLISPYSSFEAIKILKIKFGFSDLKIKKLQK